jgi:integrase
LYKAKETVRAMELHANALPQPDVQPEAQPEPTTIEQAIAAFLHDREKNITTNGGENRPLSADRLKKYKRLLEALSEHCKNHRIVYLKDFVNGCTQAFRATWPDDTSKTSFLKKNELLQGVFSYFVESGLIAKNPIGSVQIPKKDQDFTTAKYVIKDQDWQKILANIDNLDSRSIDRTRAIALFGYDSGCRIEDIVCLERAQVDLDNRTYDLVARKNGKRNYGPLSDATVAALRKIPDNGTKYFWWTGKGLSKSAVADARRPFARLCKLADFKFNFHMWRHTRITKRLMIDMSFAKVADMAGDTETIIRKHYWHADKNYRGRVNEEARKAI